MASIAGRKDELKAHIDLGVAIPKISFLGLPPNAWPKVSSVDIIATEVAKFAKRGMSNT